MGIFSFSIVLAAALFGFAALPCAAAAADAKTENASHSDFVTELRRSVPFDDNDVIPAGETYIRMTHAVAAAFRSNAKLRMKELLHRRKWQVDAKADERTGSSFRCSPIRSPVRPRSVHKLRPADIDVIAAIGDSLTAGMGIHSGSVATIFTQYRGHSFTMGGKEDLRQHTTLPTILKKFNPKLIGYSTGISGPDGVYAGFNEAVVGNRAEDMPRQARQIVEKLKNSKDVDFNSDWKIMNLFIGGNDACDFCKDRNRFSTDNYEKHIRTAIEYFYENVPRVFVNLIEMMDISVVSDLKDQSLVCKALLQTFWCKCGSTLPREEVRDYSRELQRRARVIAADPKWNTRADFTVVLQPFLRNMQPPVLPDGEPDLSYFAPDCFHLSARGHALGGVSLWNSMLEPVGQKRTSWILNDKVNCPSQSAPYLATKLNSAAAADDKKQ